MALVIFNLALESVFLRALGPRMTGRCRARLREAGLDLARPLLPAYPPEDFSRWMGICLEELFPGLPTEQAEAELGELTFGAFTGGKVGSAVGAVMRVVGPERALLRLERILKTAQSELSARFDKLAERDYQVELGPLAGRPHYYRGLLLAGGRFAGGQAMQVELLRTAGQGAVYRVRWG